MPLSPPLTRASVAAGSRIMLPAYVILEGIVGTVYCTDPQGRLGRAPALTQQRDWLPLPVWGGIMLALAMMTAAALLDHNRWTTVWALCIGLLVWLVWGVTLELSVFLSNQTSYLAGTLGFFAATCYSASIYSLFHDMRDHRP